MKNKKQILLLIALGFLFNLFWEISHSFFYDWNKLPLHNNVYFFISKILYSTFGDLILLTTIFAIVSLRNMNFKWIQNPRKSDYLKIATLGFVFSFLIELRAINQGRWFYNAMMPTIYGIGIFPLVQLAIIGILVLRLSK
jgi:hypothetical protein